MKSVYIVKAYRTAVGKAIKGSLRFVRPEDMAAPVIQRIMKEVPNLEPSQIDDLIVGNAMPEAEQGLNVGRLISLMGFGSLDISGMTVNRYCASGLETIAIAAAKIEAGISDCVVAGGVESMSYIPMGGYKATPHPDLAKENPSYYWGMGLTAEEVAQRYKVSREEQDQFAFESHEKALKAIENDTFGEEIVPIEVNYSSLKGDKEVTTSYTFKQDEGPRKGTSVEGLSKLRPVFAQGGSVTAGNSSQMSDGASFLLLMSEDMVKKTGAEPIAKFVNYATVGVEPRVMGIGPLDAIPKALKQAGLKLQDMDRIELNEAFASQSVAIKKGLDINPDVLNVNGGAIALGHPLGCTGAKLSTQIIHELGRTKGKYGLVTMCVGTGQGAAGIIEKI